MTPPTDPELVRRCLASDQSAWSTLAARYSDLVYGVAWRSGLRGQDAGDVVQEVFVALWKSLPRLERTERLMAWILKTARREAWRQVRRARASRRREEAVARPDRVHGPLPAEALVELEEEERVRAAFRQLSERCRRLLDALFFETTARPYAEIAEELGMAIGSLGPTRRRCLESLRVALEAEGMVPKDVSDGEAASSGGAAGR